MSLVIDITKTKDTELKVLLFGSKSDPSARTMCRADYTQVSELSGRLREELANLAECYHTIGRNYDSALRSIRSLGRALFSQLLGGPRSKDYRKAIAQIRGLRGSVCTIYTDESVAIPWNFLVENVSQDFLPQFFCGVSVLFGNLPHQDDSDEEEVVSYELVSVLCEELFNWSAEQLEEDERQTMDLVNAMPLGATNRWHEAEVLWRSLSQRALLFHIFSHASPDSIRLRNGADNEVIDAILFEDSITCPYHERRVHPLNFFLLNGCSTAAGTTTSGSFAAPVSRLSGQSDFVGLEDVVPPVFALRFGYALIARLLCGETLQTALNKLQRLHFPLSLLYTCYGSSKFQIIQDESSRRLLEDVVGFHLDEDTNFSCP